MHRSPRKIWDALTPNQKACVRSIEELKEPRGPQKRAFPILKRLGILNNIPDGGFTMLGREVARYGTGGKASAEKFDIEKLSQEAYKEFLQDYRHNNSIHSAMNAAFETGFKAGIGQGWKACVDYIKNGDAPG